MRLRWRNHPRGARLEGWGGPKIAAPHHEAERDRVCIKLTGICFREKRKTRTCASSDVISLVHCTHQCRSEDCHG
jgi:hypothetical protein